VNQPEKRRPEWHIRTNYLFLTRQKIDFGYKRSYCALDAGGVKYLTEGHFQLGAPRIVEFERAVRQSKRTLLVVSPNYLDGHFNQYVDILVNSYGLETGSWPVIPMIIQPVTLPIRLSQLVALDATEPDEWEHTLQRLFATLELPVPDVEDQAFGEPPFKGLLYFDVNDDALFFGREALTAELAARLPSAPHSPLFTSHFLDIVGASGSGKSSLARAGLIPTLITANPGWIYRILTPLRTPSKNSPRNAHNGCGLAYIHCPQKRTAGIQLVRWDRHHLEPGGWFPNVWAACSNPASGYRFCQ
jgi:hypothetical protein